MADWPSIGMAHPVQQPERLAWGQNQGLAWPNHSRLTVPEIKEVESCFELCFKQASYPCRLAVSRNESHIANRYDLYLISFE